MLSGIQNTIVRAIQEKGLSPVARGEKRAKEKKCQRKKKSPRLSRAREQNKKKDWRVTIGARGRGVRREITRLIRLLQRAKGSEGAREWRKWDCAQLFRGGHG